MKNLVIVTTKDTDKYGQYLMQLIGLNDDTEDKIIGTKDGDVKAAVYTEEDYKANRVNMSSSQYILFVGNDKYMKERREHMKVVYNKYGMQYGNFGKQAFLYVNKVVRPKEYNDFIEMYKKMQSDVKEVVLSGKDAAHIAVGAAIGGAAELGVGGIWTGIALATGIFAPIGLVMAAGAGIAAGVVSKTKHSKITKEVIEQQYNCLILTYYLEGINIFLSS